MRIQLPSKKDAKSEEFEGKLQTVSRRDGGFIVVPADEKEMKKEAKT